MKQPSSGGNNFLFRIRTLGILTALALVGASCSSNSQNGSAVSAETTAETTVAEPCVKVAVLILANEADNGWSYSHIKGAESIKEKIACAEVTILKDVPESPEVEGTLQQLVADGNQLIISTSFGYQDYLNKVAADHPDVKFEQLTGLTTSENVSSFFGASEDAGYLSGIAAGKVTKTGVIGYVAPFGIPNIVRAINGLALGAQSVNPNVKVKVVFVNSWYDPTLERQAADSLFAEGADVVGMNMDSPAVGESARDNGGHWVGFTSPQISVGYPEGFLTAPVYNWAQYYVQRTQDVIDGTWKSQNYYGGLSDGFISLAPFGPSVDADLQAMIVQRQKEIVDGTFQIWKGPIQDQNGKEVVARGVTLTLDQLFGTSYLVKGVSGQLPG